MLLPMLDATEIPSFKKYLSAEKNMSGDIKLNLTEIRLKKSNFIKHIHLNSKTNRCQNRALKNNIILV